jgi:hypothetical protein
MKEKHTKIRATSLMSEHSTEYYLVPRMLSILKRSYESVTPIYPTMMGEFGKKSYKHQGGGFRALAIFPRRPKLKDDLSSEIYITVNQKVREFEHAMRTRGIPTIAGCPLVKTIWELSCDPKIAWIDINHPSLNKYLNQINHGENSAALLTEEEVLRRVLGAATLSLECLGNAVRTFRSMHGGSFIYGQRYKPIFFLIR